MKHDSDETVDIKQPNFVEVISNETNGFADEPILQNFDETADIFFDDESNELFKKSEAEQSGK